MKKKFAKFLPWQLSSWHSNKFVGGFVKLDQPSDSTKWTISTYHWSLVNKESICRPTLPVFVPHKLLVLRTTRKTRRVAMLSIFRPIKTHLELQRVFFNTLLGHQWEKSEPQKQYKTKSQEKNTQKKGMLCQITSHQRSQHKPHHTWKFVCVQVKETVFFFNPANPRKIDPLNCFSFIFPDWEKLFLLSSNITSSFVQFPNMKDFVVIFALVISTHVLDVNTVSKCFNWKDWVKSQTWFSKLQQPLFSKWWNESAKKQNSWHRKVISVT